MPGGISSSATHQAEARGPHAEVRVGATFSERDREVVRDWYGDRARQAGRCPPGLAKKYPGCIPPGQWKKGYRIPSTWSNYYVGYDRLPDFYRDRYEMNPDYRYMYRDGRVYVIDAITRSIIDVLTR